MKKLFLIIIVFALVACSKESRIGEYSGSEERTYSIAESYLKLLATDLIPDYLISLESALTYDEYEYYKTSAGRSSYETGGKSICEPGVEWTVNAKKKVNGLKITCKGDGVWELYREGPYAYSDREEEEEYTTSCTVTATMANSHGHGHFDWKVIFSGSRTEREGYSCIFQSTPDMTYVSDDIQSYSWSKCYGSATIMIDKNGEKVDMARMDYDGKDVRFYRGL